nr:MAG TPA: alpha-amylase [Caudoviricetes sp.]
MSLIPYVYCYYSFYYLLLFNGLLLDSSESAFPARIVFSYCIKVSKGFGHCYVFS